MAIYGMKVGSSGAGVDVNGHIWHEGWVFWCWVDVNGHIWHDGYGLLLLGLM